MSEHKGPFDAAMVLEHLRNGCLWDSKARDDFRSKYPDSSFNEVPNEPCPICDRISAILEAAGKVDKRDALSWLDYCEHNWPNEKRPDIRALFESLPEPEEERK